MKKKIYLNPKTEVINLPYQPLLAGSPIDKSTETIDEFEDLMSRELDVFDLQ
jgi:hypothetical protein